MEPIGTITNMAALGGVAGAAIAMAEGKEDDASYIVRGTVVGAAVGIGRVLIEALSS